MTAMVELNVEKKKDETWWKGRTNMERCVTLSKIIEIIIGISALTVMVYMIYNWNPQTINIEIKDKTPQEIGEKQENVCNSAECIHTASRVLKYMDKNKDPCENFYDFACGNFVENTNIPDDVDVMDSFTLTNHLIEEQFINILEKPIQNDELYPFQLIKKIYNACLGKQPTETIGLTTMNNILKKLGGWPVLHGDSWTDDRFDWKNCDSSLRKLGYDVSYFLNFEISGLFDNSFNRIQLDVPSLIIPGSDDESMEKYYKFMVDIAELFGADRKRAEAELHESLAFELELYEILRNSSLDINHLTIAQLETNFSSIPWTKYINNLLAPDIQVTKDEIVTVLFPGYITSFEAIISKTPKRVQANYVMWRAIADSLQFLTEDLRRKQSDFLTSIGEINNLPRRKQCLQDSIFRLDIASEALYVSKYFNGNAKQRAEQIVADIRSEFYDILKDVDWMDEKTKKYALEKTVTMKTNIGYPDELIDKVKLEEYYKGLELDTDDYLLSILKIEHYKTSLSYQNLEQRVNKTDWTRHSDSASSYAYYAVNRNTIELPAGSLQGIFFDVDRPRYMNYAAIGFIIGQTLTDGFNEIGNLFYNNGDLVDDWWQNQTRTALREKVQCFVDQYRKYPVSELLEQDEMFIRDQIIADNGGIKFAYLAYRKWLERNGLEPKLPGLNYSTQQMFWISAANTLCTKYGPKDTISGYILPANFRVLGAMSNSEHFTKDFNCPKGSAMNPSKSCQVW